MGHELPVPAEWAGEIIRAPGIRRLAGDGGGDPFWGLLDYHREEALVGSGSANAGNGGRAG